jgi:hypothetical protein
MAKPRDTENYLYVELALPKHHPAIQRLLGEITYLHKQRASHITELLIKLYAEEPLVDTFLNKVSTASVPPVEHDESEREHDDKRVRSDIDDDMDELLGLGE